MRVGKRVGLIAAAAAGLTIATGIGARGADMPVAYTKAPFVPAPAYNWSGFYAGVTAGGGLAALPVTNMDGFIGATLDGLALKSVGGVAGVHLGYNWQFAPSFLVGLEGDLNASSFKASDWTCFGNCFDANPHISSSRLNEFSTLRARLGLAADRTLLFVEAGPAFGRINASLTVLQCLDTRFCAAPGAPFAFASDSGFHAGVVLGAGVEYALASNWIFRGEYLHLDFAGKDASFVGLGGAGPAFRIRSTATADIARLGISYRVW